MLAPAGRIRITFTAMKRVIRKEVLVPASAADVWRAWTTTEGVTTFFAPKANIDLSLGGPYEVYFLLDNPPGTRGSEDCKVVLFDPDKHTFSVSWNAPPHLPLARKEKTRVEVRLTEEGGKTRVVLHQSGWKEGPEAQACYEYFQKAWDVVLARLVQRFETGKPIDWKAVATS